MSWLGRCCESLLTLDLTDCVALDVKVPLRQSFAKVWCSRCTVLAAPALAPQSRHPRRQTTCTVVQCCLHFLVDPVALHDAYGRAVWYEVRHNEVLNG